MDVTTVTDGVSVHGTTRRTPQAELQRLADALDRHPEAATDQASATRLLEQEAARVLGKPAAMLLPSGKMAQQIALRIHADRRPGRRTFLAHPANHLTLWEDGNHARLHDVHARLVGDRHSLLSTRDLRDGMTPEVAAAVWELPQRELGGELPTWDSLRRQLTHVRTLGVATHLDGARIWQVGPFYRRPLDEICDGFDSVYASLYKDLEAPRGAVLAGDAAFVDTARTWRHRMGGTVDEAWPLALLALVGLERVGDAMPRYVAHAQALAAAITQHTCADVRPDPPQAAMFHVHLPVAPAAAEAAHAQLLHEGGPRLALRVRTDPNPSRCAFEVTVGEAALSLTPARVAAAVTRLVELAHRPVQDPGAHA